MQSYIKYSVILFLVTLIGCKSDENTKPLNILWIVSDDLGTDLGCYGNKAVKTPNLDRFASESVLYTNMHTSSPVCSSSRSGMITGMHPVSIDCHQHRTSYKNPLPGDVEPVTEYFKRAGYFVTNGNNNLSRKGKTDYNFQYRFDSLYEGRDYRERAEGQPFFAQIQIFLPHRPFHKDSLNPVDTKSVSIPPYYPDHPITRKDWALYLETIQHVDEQFGKVMKRLEEDSVLKNTVVFFIGDQGRPHLRAKQFLYEAGTHTPFMIRWPDGKSAGTKSNDLLSNIDLAPASLKLAGIDIPAHVQGVDFLDPAQKRKFIFTAKDRMDGTVDRQRAIRNEQFRYIKNYYPERSYTQFNTYKKMSYPVLTLMQVMNERGELNKAQLPFMADSRPAEELYDLKNDPFELDNLASNSSYSDVLESMRITLNDLVDTYDKGIYPENEDELKRAKETMERAYERKLKNIGLDPSASSTEFLKYWEEQLINNQLK